MSLGYVIVSNRTFRCLATPVSVSYLNFTPIIILILLPVGWMQRNQAAISGAPNNGDFSAHKVFQGIINKLFCGIRSCFYELRKFSWWFWWLIHPVQLEPENWLKAFKEFFNLAWGFELLLSCQMQSQLQESGFPFEVGNNEKLLFCCILKSLILSQLNL